MSLQHFSAPPDVADSFFELQGRTAHAGDWARIETIRADSMSDLPHAHGGAEAFAAVVCEAPVEFRLTIAEPVRHVVVRPSLRDPIETRLDGHAVCFALSSPRYVMIEINHVDDLPRHTFYLFLDAPDPHAPRPGDPRVKYLPPGHHVANEFAAGDAHTVVLLPGVHQVEENRISLESNKTLYLSGGAHLRAYVIGDEVHNAAIRGPGVIDGTGLPCRSREWRDDGDAAFVFFRRGSRNTIDGPIIYDSPFWNIVTFGSRQMRIRNHKAVTWKMNNDGVQPRSCNDLLVEHCFLKCADDCIAIKTRRAAGMQSRNLIFRNLVLFNDKPGNPMEIGHTSQADLLGDVVFEHIDVVFAHGGHTISVTLIDHCTVRDIVYRGIRVEGHRTHEIKLVITTSKYTTDDQRGQIRNVMIDDILLTGSPLGGLIAGFDEAHMIRDVTIRNMRFLETAGGHPRVVESIEAIGIEMRLAERVVVIAGN